MRIRAEHAVVGLLAIGVVIAGCSDGEETDGGFFAQRLDMIPESATGEGLMRGRVVITDIDAAAAVAGVERPSGPVADEVVPYVEAITGGGPSGEVVHAQGPVIIAPVAMPRVDEFHDELGWSIADVSWFAEYQVPAAPYAVFGGEFSGENLDAAMGERVEDIWYLGPDDEFAASLDEGTAARPTGLPMRIARIDGNLAVTQRAESLKDGLSGEEPSLADHSVYSSLAKAMNEADAYSACFLVEGDHSLASSDAVLRSGMTADEIDALRDQLMPEPFDGVGAGVSDRDGEQVITLAYAHGSESAAADNAENLRRYLEEGRSIHRRPWSELFTVEDVRADGALATATLIAQDGFSVTEVFGSMGIGGLLTIHA